MLRIKRILMATDLSPDSEPALREAIRMAAEHDAELHLLYVIVLLSAAPEHPGMALLDQAKIYERLQEACQAGLEELRGTVDDDALKVSIETQRGLSVADVIVERAKELDADLVVLGTHGRRGPQRWLIGSVAEWVMRSIDRSVLVVHRDETRVHSDPRPVANVLVPVDFSDYSAPAVRTAQQLAERYGATVHLLHALYLESHPFYGASAVADLVGGLRRRCGEEMEALWARTGATDVDYQVHLPTGRPAPVVAEFVAEHNIDLVVLSSHGHGIERLLLGSTSEGIVRRARCPVLMLRADGKSLLEAAEVEKLVARS